MYRIIELNVVEITDEEEIAEITSAANLRGPLSPVSEHIRSALDFLSNRKSPDYRNSIKESISAVEAVSKIIAKDPSATLAQALKSIDGTVELHPALKGGFTKLYGYTNDEDGVRHAMMEVPNLDAEDARFMLVACSTFVNDLAIKAKKARLLS